MVTYVVHLDYARHTNRQQYHGGNTKIAICAIDRAGIAKSGFRPSSTDVDKGTNSLNALKVRYFSIGFCTFWVQTISENVCYCFSGLEVWKIACLNAKRY